MWHVPSCSTDVSSRVVANARSRVIVWLCAGPGGGGGAFGHGGQGFGGCLHWSLSLSVGQKVWPASLHGCGEEEQEPATGVPFDHPTIFAYWPEPVPSRTVAHAACLISQTLQDGWLRWCDSDAVNRWLAAHDGVTHSPLPPELLSVTVAEPGSCAAGPKYTACEPSKVMYSLSFIQTEANVLCACLRTVKRHVFSVAHPDRSKGVVRVPDVADPAACISVEIISPGRGRAAGLDLIVLN